MNPPNFNTVGAGTAPIYLQDEKGNWTLVNCQFCAKPATFSCCTIKPDKSTTPPMYVCQDHLRNTLSALPPPPSLVSLIERLRTVIYRLENTQRVGGTISEELADEIASVARRVIDETVAPPQFANPCADGCDNSYAQ